jgi:hypothetical protein
MAWPRLRLPPGLGRAFWLALLLVGGVEASLHSEAVIHRYRAVFALGRAYDKLHFAERHPPRILFVGKAGPTMASISVPSAGHGRMCTRTVSIWVCRARIYFDF